MPDDQTTIPKEAQAEEFGNFNFISVVSKSADENLMILRSVSTALALTGIFIVGRSIKLITKFISVSEIPQRFFERNVSLRGRLRSLSDAGLEVEHVPIYVPVLSPLFVKCETGAAGLQVHLAGVQPSLEGWEWMRQQLKPDDTLWLKLISHQGGTLYCWVSQSPGYPFSVALNEELLRQGLARSGPIVGLDPRSPVYWRFHRKLLKAELLAEKKGRGMWREPSMWERGSSALKENVVVRSCKRLVAFISRSKGQ